METDVKTEIIENVKRQVRDLMDFNKKLDDEDMMECITEIVFDRAKDNYLSLSDKRDIIHSVFNALRRLDILQPLIEDNSITEIMVNGPFDIFVEKSGVIYKTEKSFENKERLEDVIQSIVSRVNRSVNESSPIVDARLKDGSRVGVVLSPVALNGPILTIRKFNTTPISMDQLISWNSISTQAASALDVLVRAKYNIFICGGTGSGKTTFLNALANFIPNAERIVTIEDSAELRLTSLENVVCLETRNANMEGRGEITIRDLIKASLRMRPDRIIVGEVRGPEALDMLQAMNTGHDGSLSTGHANSPMDMLSRLETMVLSGTAMPMDAIRRQIVSAIDIIVHLSRLRDGSRRVVEIAELIRYEEGQICINPLYQFVEASNENEMLTGELKWTGNEVERTFKLQRAGIKEKGMMEWSARGRY